MPPQKRARFYVRDIDPKIWREFRILAIKNDMGKNELLNILIRQAVEFARERDKTADGKPK